MTDVNITNKEQEEVRGGDVNYCCEGCNRVAPEDHSRCTVYINPDVIWRRGNCPLASHIKVESAKKSKVRVGQQKQKKH
jgi:hypothetical protein